MKLDFDYKHVLIELTNNILMVNMLVLRCQLRVTAATGFAGAFICYVLIHDLNHKVSCHHSNIIYDDAIIKF